MRLSTLIIVQQAYVVALTCFVLVLFSRRNYGRRVFRAVSRSPFGRPPGMLVRPMRTMGRSNAGYEGTISYSLYGNYAKYVPTLMRAVTDAANVMPTWQVRVHAAADAPQDAIEFLVQNGCRVLVMGPNPPMGHEGAVWRFLPAAEEKPFVSLDADDPVTEKTAKNVRDWLASGKRFVLLGRHRFIIPISAGLWGSRDRAIPDIQERIDAYSDTWFGFDEAFLHKEIWPIMQRDRYHRSYPNTLKPLAIAGICVAIVLTVLVISIALTSDAGANFFVGSKEKRGISFARKQQQQ